MKGGGWCFVKSFFHTHTLLEAIRSYRGRNGGNEVFLFFNCFIYYTWGPESYRNKKLFFMHGWPTPFMRWLLVQGGERIENHVELLRLTYIRLHVM
jgi:hypothetical protein